MYIKLYILFVWFKNTFYNFENAKKINIKPLNQDKLNDVFLATLIPI